MMQKCLHTVDGSRLAFTQCSVDGECDVETWMQQDFKREAWSAAAARGKIAPGQVRQVDTLAALHAGSYIPENTHTQQGHSKMSATGLPWAGEVLPRA
jgi:hypothetical protein